MCTMWDAIKDQTGIILLRVVTASMWTNDCCRGSCEFCLWIAKTLLLRVIATFVVHVVPVHENDMDQKFISDLITQNHRIINRGKVVRDFPQVTTANDCFVKCRPRKSKFLIFPQFAYLQILSLTMSTSRQIYLRCLLRVCHGFESVFCNNLEGIRPY